MIDIREAFRIMDEMADISERHQVIYIESIVTPTFDETLSSVNLEDRYDPLIIDEWYDFVMTLEDVINRLGVIVNEIHSIRPDSLSDYIDFYITNKTGTRTNYLLDIRLSVPNAQRAEPDSGFLTINIDKKHAGFEKYNEIISYIKDMILEMEESE